MRRVTALFFALTLIFTLTACGSGAAQAETGELPAEEAIGAIPEEIEEEPEALEKPETEEPTAKDDTETEEVAETEEPAETEEDTAAVEEIETDEETAEEPLPGTEYTYSDLDAVMYAACSVNVRDMPSTDGERVGGLSADDEVHVTGQCNETSWYRIEYKNAEAYVSNSYLGTEKTEAAKAVVSENQTTTQTVAQTATTQAATQTTAVSSGLSELYDMHSILALVNQDRAEYGSAALVWDDALYQEALNRIYVVEFNCKNNIYAHTGKGDWYGENAQNVTSSNGLINNPVQYVDKIWTMSPGHQNNRINSKWTKYAAVGCYDGMGTFTAIELFVQ